MKSSRRTFLKNFSITSAWLLAGGIQELTASAILSLNDKVKFRFAIASDGHYGQPDTTFDDFLVKITQHINLFHKKFPLQGCVINGDIIHDKIEFLVQAKQKLDQLTILLRGRVSPGICAWLWTRRQSGTGFVRSISANSR